MVCVIMNKVFEEDDVSMKHFSKRNAAIAIMIALSSTFVGCSANEGNEEVGISHQKKHLKLELIQQQDKETMVL